MANSLSDFFFQFGTLVKQIEEHEAHTGGNEE
jgi:hypothetical protein